MSQFTINQAMKAARKSFAKDSPGIKPVKVKNPEKYLHSMARRRAESYKVMWRPR